MFLQQCISNMKEEESKLYQDSTATSFFNYIYNSEEFQNILAKMVPNETITEEEWTFLFEKLYLVTNKAKSEEGTPKLLDGIMYLISRLGTKVFPKDSPQYNDYYKDYEVIRSLYRTKEVNDFLLQALTETMNSRSQDDFTVLLKMHQEAILMRNRRDYMYEETLKSSEGELTTSEIVAINTFNRSYEREKKLVLEYKK